jgi:GDPmannose 4,6-dehydratase
MKAIVTGILGQDGRLLAHQLGSVGYEIIGIARHFDKNEKAYIDPFGCDEIIAEDLSIPSVANSVLDHYKPDRIFHMAGIHTSAASMSEFGEVAYNEMYGCHVEITKNILEWQSGNQQTKSVIALSSQMYTPASDVTVISEGSIPNPSSKYGSTKLAAFELIKRYRLENQCKAAGAILFNHTSILSKDQFLFPLLANQLLEVIAAKRQEIQLLNADASIDMSSAEEVCAGIISMTDIELMEDLVFSSGSLTTVRSVIEEVLTRLSINAPISITSTREHAKTESVLLGNPARAREVLGWKPEKTPADILFEMVNNFRKESM